MVSNKIEAFEEKVMKVVKQIKGTTRFRYRNIHNKKYYIEEVYKKEKIVLHHTVGNLYGDFLALTQQNKISTAYLIGRKGQIINLFPDEYWSYHLGKSALGGNEKQSKISIGIELSNYGCLTLKDGILYNAYKQPYCKEEETDKYTKTNMYRDYEYWCNYTEEQYTALKKLLLELTKNHGISYEFLPVEKRMEFTQDVIPFKGIVSHVNYRLDKTDVSPIFDYQKIML